GRLDVCADRREKRAGPPLRVVGIDGFRRDAAAADRRLERGDDRRPDGVWRPFCLERDRFGPRGGRSGRYGDQCVRLESAEVMGLADRAQAARSILMKTEIPGPRSRELLALKERVLPKAIDLHIPAVAER